MPALGTTSRAAQRAAWCDSARFGAPGSLHGELLCEALDIHPGERVLDVATGSGTAALAAARRWADVIAVDLVDHLLDSAQRIAEAFGLSVCTQHADAQDLPFEDDSFDVVMSTFGSMFSPDQQAVADEAVRVCRPCGRIGLAAWVPASLGGEVCKVTGLPRAVEWGTKERIRELFGNRINALRITTRQLTFRYRSPQHMLEYLRTWDGPTMAAFDALEAGDQDRLAADLLDVYATYNRATDGTLVAPSDYLEIVATVR